MATETFESGSLRIEAAGYEIEYEAGTVSGGGAIFLRLPKGRNLPIRITSVDAVVTALLRMKRTADTFETEA